YKLHGNLEGVGTFGQETLIGNFINNRHGTRSWGESLINNYNVGFAMHNEVKCKRTSTMDEVVGPFDLETTSFDKLLHESHDSLCKCGKIDECTKPTTITMDEALTTRPRAPPRRVFTPTQRTPQPSHYLLLFEDTDSYQIVARSSVKQINDNVVTIIIRNKLVKTKAVCQGSLDECNSEYTRLTRISQTANNQDSGKIQMSICIIKYSAHILDNFSENEKLIIDDSSTENSIHDLSKRLSNASMSPVLTAIHSSRQIPDDGKVFFTLTQQYLDFCKMAASFLHSQC
ncbi:unnamed protein product, partial [Rotaria magnacalcarata]